MTITSTIGTDEIRVLDMSEIEAVTGAAKGDCNGGKVISVKLPGGTLDMGYEVCEGMGGVQTPWAVWTPNGKK
jgi:hypothetical protein